MVNLDFQWKQMGWIKVPLADLGVPTDATYRVHDLMSGHTYHWNHEWNYVELTPQGKPAHIFRLEFDSYEDLNNSAGSDFYTE